ncbi:histidine kinase [Streptomyces durbertensis]|uniref:Histidine kinase n=1 Tax=Streptomyces durbertensis TaxID=2448886 RepID=A0ABR6EA31_9ACTN|nr:histidine kinase [Streptomyces durbertensis]MBB1242209.1 histidine kinase [Streptomyces durbertensis]
MADRSPPGGRLFGATSSGDGTTAEAASGRGAGAWARLTGRLPGRDLPPPRLARLVTVVALCCYGSVTVLNVLRSSGPGMAPSRLVALIGLVLAVFAVQFLVTSSGFRRRYVGWSHALLAVQAALTYGPMLMFGVSWGSMQGPLAASVLLVLGSRLAWPLFGVVVAIPPVHAHVGGEHPAQVGYFLIAGLLGGFTIYGLSRLTDLVHEVHANRAQLARMAVGQERLRFARDLHDLLGYSLSAIALKGELVQRLITTRPDRAEVETAELLRIARQALADVRLVSSGYRNMSLREEAESAAAVLSAADVVAEVEIGCDRLHPVVDTVLATALREGVTNILRHSEVRHCRVSATVEGEEVRLTLVNDGAARRTKESVKTDGGGSGLTNLSERFAAIGGRLTAGARDDGHFELVAAAPLSPRNSDGPTADGTRASTLKAAA